MVGKFYEDANLVIFGCKKIEPANVVDLVRLK
jgi:hypothetical protein